MSDWLETSLGGDRYRLFSPESAESALRRLPTDNPPALGHPGRRHRAERGPNTFRLGDVHPEDEILDAPLPPPRDGSPICPNPLAEVPIDFAYGDHLNLTATEGQCARWSG